MSVRAILDQVQGLSEGERQALAVALVQRENEMADKLRMIGAQFGMYPQIVALALAEVGLGTPVTEEELALLRQNYINLIEQLNHQNGENG
jgi:hypothetical protein